MAEQSNNREESPSFYVTPVWVADNGDGTYKNPILHADYSDPDVIRFGRDYYMTASTFTYFPGLPILRSKDLVNWQLIAHALQRYPDKRFDRPQHGRGVWAPSIRFHENRFFIYWGDPDAGIYRVGAPSPEGPWDPPVLLLPGKGLIDPCPFWEEDGRAYLIHTWAESRAGFNSLLTLREMSPDGRRISPDGRHIFDGRDKHPTIEGPKLYKRNGYYYIFAPAGGVARGWQTVLRAKNLYGPYEDRIVLAQGSTEVNGPHQGGWVETPDGRSWFLHFQDKHAYGRVIHLQPVRWIDDWPVIGQDQDADGIGRPVAVFRKPDLPDRALPAPLTDTDRFHSGKPGLQWHWQANPQPNWHQPLSDRLRLYAVAPGPKEDLRDAGNLLLQRFPAPDFQATAKMTLVPEKGHPCAGLVIMGREYACIELIEKENKYWLRQITCRTQEQIVEEKPLDTDTVFLRVSVTSPNALCRFAYCTEDNPLTEIGCEFQARPGRWVGAKVGLFCLSPTGAPQGGYADFEWFRIEPVGLVDR